MEKADKKALLIREGRDSRAEMLLTKNGYRVANYGVAVGVTRLTSRL